ncbi:MAG: 4Fe-4S binding protein [Promethearchaeota archaeon]
MSEMENINTDSEKEQKMREIARKLLEDHQVSMILGFEVGTLPLMTRPIFIKDPQDVSKLVWGSTCSSNLVRFLPRGSTDKKIGIILKSCDARSLILLINEKQINRDNVVLIIIPCGNGMIARNKLIRNLDEQEILESKISENRLSIHCSQFEREYDISDIVSEECKFCNKTVPAVYDYVIGNPTQKQDSGTPDLENYSDIAEFEKKSPEQRWAYFNGEFDRCTRCYSCREACPLCYCDVCFIDQNQPQWFGRESGRSENILFHMTRAIHLAGRCVGCGACSRACPEGIDIYKIFKEIRHSSYSRWHVNPGVKLGEPAIMASFTLEDPQEFIVHED